MEVGEEGGGEGGGGSEGEGEGCVPEEGIEEEASAGSLKQLVPGESMQAALCYEVGGIHFSN